MIRAENEFLFLAAKRACAKREINLRSKTKKTTTTKDAVDAEVYIEILKRLRSCR